MKKKYIYMLVFIVAFLALIVIANSVSADRFVVTLNQDDILDDGEIEMQGGANKDNTSQTALARWEPGPGTDTYRGFISFDISSIPASATIMHTKIQLNVVANWDNDKAVVWDLYHDPRYTSAADIETDCANGTNFGNKVWPTGLITADLDNINNASTRIQENVTRGWWGVGFDANGPSLVTRGMQFATSRHTSYTTPKLIVTYELNAPLVNNTLTTPADGATNVNLTDYTCINVSHPNGNHMNITWLWYNSSSASWEEYGFNGTGGNIEDFENYTAGNDPNADWYTYEEWKTVNGPVIANVTDNGISLDDQSMLFDTSANLNKEEMWAFNFTENPYHHINFSIYPRTDDGNNRMTFLIGSAAQPLGFGFWFEDGTNNIEVYNNAPWTDTGINWAPGNWYNISFGLNYTTHKFLFAINGTKVGWYSFKNNIDKFHSLWMYDSSGTEYTNMFLDNLALNYTTCALANGTYCTQATFATEPCTKYYWSVDIYDNNGNLTQELYEFTTHCIDPPTAVTCNSPNPTGINLTFTKDDDAGGTTYTVMYYAHGSNPPVYGGGTYGGNTTKEFFNITGLDEGQCYAYSLWTFWHSPDGRWFSSGVAHKICCAAGGDYWVMFFDEETREPLNFTRYPWDNTTFALKVHYYSTTEDTFYIQNNSSPKIWRDTNVEDLSFVNISATQDVWYFELIVNYDYEYTALENGETSRTQYKRCLTPNAAIETNITTLPWDAAQFEVRDSLYFYIANLTTYGANYWYRNTTGTLEELTDSDFQDSVVKYEYNLYDSTGEILSSDPNEAYITIYERNLTNDIIIHQEYVDAAGKINPALIYEKDYLMGASTSTFNTTNFGIAPTDTDTSPVILIRSDFTEEQLEANVDISWTFEGKYLNITFEDTSYLTNSVTLQLYKNNTNASNLVKTKKVYLNSYTFVYDGVINNVTYVALFTVNISDTIDGTLYSNSISMMRHMFSGISDIISRVTIENLIVGITGVFPVPGMTWVSFFILMISLVLMMMVFAKAGPVAGFLTGAFTIGGISSLVSDLSPVNITIAVILGTLAFIILIAQRGGEL